MMKKILTAMAIALMAVACTQKEEQPVQYGEISIKLANEVGVEVTTKAYTELTPEQAADYWVYITGGTDYAGYSSKYAEFEPQRLPLGTYTVSAENITAGAAEEGMGEKRLYGATEVTLSTENINPDVEVNCSVANALVTVEFDSESVDPAQFNDLKVKVTGGDSGRTFTVLAAGEASGNLQSVGNTEIWFNPSTVSYKISGTFIQTGKVVDITGSKALVAKNHMKILVSVNLENGQISNDLILNVDPTIDSNIQEEDAEFNPYDQK